MMKTRTKFLLPLMLLCIALFALALTASATIYTGECGDNLTWMMDKSTGVLEIAGTGEMKDYSSYSYSSYAPWHSYISSIKTVKIANGVTSIGDCAFSDCSEPTSITIPDSVTSIGDHAFYNCSNLTSITIPNDVTSIRSHAFFRCENLKVVNTASIASWCNVSFEDSVANPLYYAKCLYLNGEPVTELAIPDGVSHIGDCAFYGDSSLISITIPDSVASIGAQAFYGCSNMTNIAIGSGMMNISSYAFAGCWSLKKVNITDIAAWFNLSFANTTANPLYYAEYLYLNGEPVADLTIPDGVVSIGSYTFGNCKSFEKIWIPENVTAIADDAFEGSSALLFVVRDSYAHAYAKQNQLPFQTTDGTASAIIASGVCGDDLEWQLDERRELRFIGTGDMWGWNTDGTPWYALRATIRAVVIPEGVTNIGEAAFYGCTRLFDVAVPNSISYVDAHAFSGCTNLRRIILPKRVASIGNYAFSGCSSLSGVTLQEGVKSIGRYAFSGCSSLANITIPDSVTSIGDYAFAECSSLKSMTIPNGVTSIESYIFSKCKDLKSISISKSVTDIDGSAFDSCLGLQAVHIDDMAAWCRISFMNWESNPLCYAQNLYLNGQPVTKLVIPDGIERINRYAFENCTGLTEVVIPACVQSIGTCAFEGCDSLAKITIENPDCEIYDAGSTISATATIYGYIGSTAQKYARRNSRRFEGKVAPHQHTYAKTFTVDAEPTCTTAGSKSRHCTVTGCSAVHDVAEIPALGHQPVAEWTVDTPATCTTSGVKSHTCSVCGEKTDITEIPKTAHTYVDGICKECGKVKPPFIPGVVTGEGEKPAKKDLLRLQKYLAGWDVKIDEAAADCNGDGKITKADLLRLQKYLAGWDVTLGE